MDPENVTSQGKFYKHEESEESNESSGSSDINSEEEHLDREDDRQCKNDVANKEPTTSMSLLENSEARQKELEEEIRCLKEKNASMEKVINSNSGFFGKNKRRIEYDLTPQDQLNRRTAVVFMKSVMFPLFQILPERWYLFSDNVDKTVCGKIVSLVTIPGGCWQTHRR